MKGLGCDSTGVHESSCHEAFSVCSQPLHECGPDSNDIYRYQQSGMKYSLRRFRYVDLERYLLNCYRNSVHAPHFSILQPVLPCFLIGSPPSLFFLKQTVPLHQLCPERAWPPIGDPLGWGGGGWRSGKDGGGSNGFVAGEDYHLL